MSFLEIEIYSLSNVCLIELWWDNSFFCINSLRLLIQDLSSFLIFPLQEFVIWDGFSEIKMEVLTCKKVLKLLIKPLAKLRFLSWSKCRQSRKRLDTRDAIIYKAILLSIKTNEMSQHFFKIHWLCKLFIYLVIYV